MLFFYALDYAKSRREIMLNYAMFEDYAKLCQVMRPQAADSTLASYAIMPSARIMLNYALDAMPEIFENGARSALAVRWSGEKST